MGVAAAEAAEAAGPGVLAAAGDVTVLRAGAARAVAGVAVAEAVGAAAVRVGDVALDAQPRGPDAGAGQQRALERVCERVRVPVQGRCERALAFEGSVLDCFNKRLDLRVRDRFQVDNVLELGPFKSDTKCPVSLRPLHPLCEAATLRTWPSGTEKTADTATPSATSVSSMRKPMASSMRNVSSLSTAMRRGRTKRRGWALRRRRAVRREGALGRARTRGRE